jgi:outer membrane protein TolC
MIGVSLAGESALPSLPHPLSLDEAVQLALRQNPSILSAVQQLKAEKGLLYQAQANLLPHLTSTASYSQMDPGLARVSSSLPNFDFLTLSPGRPLKFNPATGANNLVLAPARQLFGPLTFVPTESWSIQLTASQLIWDGGASIAARRAARISEDAAYYSLRDTVDTVVSTVRTQFYQILLNRALIQVQEESVNLLQRSRTRRIVSRRDQFRSSTCCRLKPRCKIRFHS